jgi:hypothetical protein
MNFESPSISAITVPIRIPTLSFRESRSIDTRLIADFSLRIQSQAIHVEKEQWEKFYAGFPDPIFIAPLLDMPIYLPSGAGSLDTFEVAAPRESV